MVRLGVHVSIAGNISNAVDRAMQRECDIFQIFSRNPRGWKFKDLSAEDVDSFITKLERSSISLAVDHMPYLPNLASPREDVYSQSTATLTAELLRCGQLHIPYLVTHLGSHLGVGIREGRRRIVDSVRTALSLAQNDVMLLLENTAGTKNSLGGSFSDIAAIIDALRNDRVGICLDTCHLLAAGYELRTLRGFESTIEEFEESIGLEKLRLIHLNDSKGNLGSALDRHEHIGLGKIGERGFEIILGHKAIRSLPIILETPVDSTRDDMENLKIARRLAS